MVIHVLYQHSHISDVRETVDVSFSPRVGRSAPRHSFTWGFAHLQVSDLP